MVSPISPSPFQSLPTRVLENKGNRFCRCTRSISHIKSWGKGSSILKYLRLQTKIARLRELVDETQGELQKFKRSERYGIFYKRHQTIWKPEDQNYQTNDDGKAALKSYQNAIVDFYAFQAIKTVTKNKWVHYFHVLVSIIVVGNFISFLLGEI